MISLMIKYLKPFTLSVIAIIAFLFVQAQTELALPDFMSDIINTGIQTGGISESVPKAIRQSEFDKLLLFMNEEEKAALKQSYRLVDNESATAEEKESYPKLTDEPLYLLDTSEEMLGKLEQYAAEPSLLVMSFDQLAQGENSTLDKNSEEAKKITEMLEAQPEGMNIFDALALMSEEQRLEMREEMSAKLTAMGDSTMQGAVAALSLIHI